MVERIKIEIDNIFTFYVFTYYLLVYGNNKYNLMGRKKLNKTDDEIREQWNVRAKKYYQRNKDRIRKERMCRYWEQKKIGKGLL